MTLSPFDEGYVAPPPPPPPAEKPKPAASPRTKPDQVTAPTDAETEAKRAAFRARVDAIEDGVYFNLPPEIYHAVERYSTSGIQKTLISPADFWRNSWMDPNRKEPDEEQTKAQIVGRAYHVARLEPDLFAAQYCRALDKSEMPKGTLFSGAAMGKALEEMGLKKTGSVGEQAERLAVGGYPGTIWHVELSEWEAQRAGRVGLDAAVFDEIVIDMERIRSIPEVAELLSGGAAEVSIFWTCPKTGIKMKCRVDYLTYRAWVDFKTFANPKGKNVEQAISDAFKYSRYYIQATNYDEAIEAIRYQQISIIGDATDAERKLIAAIALKDDRLECWFVFQQKGGVPNIFGKRIRFYEVPFNVQAQHAGASAEAIAKVEKATETPQLWFTRARREIVKAKRLFRVYSDTFPPGEAWRPINPIGEISDLSFNAFWLDEEVG